MPNFDIVESKRKLAVEAGAVEVSWRDMVKMVRAETTPSQRVEKG